MLPTPYDISGCYSEDTEVLTKRGWVLHQDLAHNDLIMTFDPKTSDLKYLGYSKLTAARYKGVMHHYNGVSTNLLVTPNHRMVMQAHWQRPGKKEGNEHIGRPDTWSHEGWEFVKSEDLKRARYYIPLSGNYRAPSGTNLKAAQKISESFEDLLSSWCGRRSNGSWRFGTNLRNLADGVQQLAIEQGYCSNLVETRNSFIVNIGNKKRQRKVISIPRNRRDVDYDGMVYCLTVPTGAYVTRKNGTMSICGNSAHWVNKPDNIIIVHRAETDNVTEIHIAKVRDKHNGKKGMTTLIYDKPSGTYSVPPAYDANINHEKKKKKTAWVSNEGDDDVRTWY